MNRFSGTDHGEGPGRVIGILVINSGTRVVVRDVGVDFSTCLCDFFERPIGTFETFPFLRFYSPTVFTYCRNLVKPRKAVPLKEIVCS